MKNYKTIYLKQVVFLFFGIALVLSAFSCNNDDEAVDVKVWAAEVQQLKNAVEPLRDFTAAQNAGYTFQATEYRTQMGFHYLNPNLLDANFEINKPEVLIFVHDPAGNMKLVAVEYGIPIADINTPPPPPNGFSGNDDVWKVDTEFNLWTLHVWAIMENTEGIFTPQNPMLP